MWLKSLWLIIIAGGAFAADDFLSHLYGLEQRNKVLLCLKPTDNHRSRECTGALLHDQWVGVRAGCLRQHPLGHMFALRPLIPGENCNNIADRHGSRYSRSTPAVFYHPWADLAIVNVDGPYFSLDNHPNSTRWAVSQALKQHGIWSWMKKYIDEFALHRNPHHYYSMLERRMIANRSPLLVMLLALIMPILMLVLVFFYIIHYTGSPSEEVPYKDLQYSKKATQV